MTDGSEKDSPASDKREHAFVHKHTSTRFLLSLVSRSDQVANMMLSVLHITINTYRL